MAAILVFSFLLFVCVTSSSTGRATHFSQCWKNNSICASFNALDAKSSYIDITLTHNASNDAWNGWFAFGFSHNNAAMRDSDVVMCYFDAQLQPQAADMYIGHGPPPRLDTDLGGQNNVHAINGTKNGQLNQITFRRPLITNDSFDKPILDYGMDIIFAYGDLSPGSQFPHNIRKHNQAGGANINFYHPNRQVLLSRSACLSPDGSSFCMSWKVFDDQSIQISLNVTQPDSNNLGWIALGLASNADSMQHADMIVGYIDPQTKLAYARDLLSQDFTTPSLDTSVGGTDDVRVVDGYIDGNERWHITFERKLDTGDTVADLVITNQTMNLIWAYGSLDSSVPTFPANMKIHSTGHNGGASANLLSEQPVDPTYDNSYQLLLGHAFLMGISWMVIVPIGAVIARYGKNYMPIWWFRHHSWLMFTAIIFTTIGFALAVTMLHGSLAFDEIHDILGLLIFIFSIIQGIMGVLADRMFDPNRKKVPIFPDILHHFTGRILGLVAWVNVYLGLALAGAHVALFVLYFIGVAFWISIFIFVQQPKDNHIQVLREQQSYGTINNDNQFNLT